MKKIISYFIRYSVGVNVLILAVFILGFLGMKQLNSSFFPLSDARFININVAYPGASPQEMEEGVVLKIEDNIRGLVGIDRFTSSSSENTAQITIETKKGADIDVVLADVKNAVDKVPSFPSGMEPPVVSKQENLTNAVSLVLSGPNLSLKALKDMGREVENDLRNLEGISQVTLSGFPEEEIEIALREQDLLAYNLTFQEVATAVAANNILSTGGSIKTPSEEYLIRINNREYYGKNLNDLILKADQNGKIVRLNDVATVRDTWSETPNRSYFNKAPSVEINVQTTNNEDLITAADLVVNYSETFNETHDGVAIDITRDASITIKQRTDLLLKNGVQGILLVLFFLSLFLRPRLAFWVAFGLPISFLGMFMFASYFDVTINVLSLFGMIIVIGILVDDGIVIAENIYQHYTMGKSKVQAAIDGTLEVLPAITSAILTTLIAFSTFFFLDGRVGEFFGEVTVIVFLTLIFSLVEALIILPAHVAHSKVLTSKQKTYSFNKWAEKVMNYMRDRLYVPSLKFVLKNPFFGISIFIGLLLITMGGFQGGIIRGTFFPVIASDQVNISIKLPEGVNPDLTYDIASQIEETAYRVGEEFTQKQTNQTPVVENIIKKIGPGNSRATITLNLLPGELRDFSANEIGTAINEADGEFPEAESIVYNSGTNFGGRPVSVSLIGNNIAELKAVKNELKAEMASLSNLQNIDDNDPAGMKEISLELTEKGYALGFNLNEVAKQVRAGFFGQQAQRFQRRQDEIKVWVRYHREGRSSLLDLESMRLKSPTGERVPLREIANYSIERGEISINHLNGKREIKVEADLKNPKESATDMLAAIQNDIMPGLTAKYPTVTALYEGQNREASKTIGSAQNVIPVIILLIYVTIAFTFRSFSQPLLLLAMIPFSLIGVAWGHFFHDFPINILSFLGIIALIGIMVNDGLVFISKYNKFLQDGMKVMDALVEAGKSRFRAIFLTSITTIAGLSPLILETSRQAQFLIPMAISIAYGIGIATALTLILLPILLSLTNQGKQYALWLWEGKKPSRESLERAVKEINHDDEA